MNANESARFMMIKVAGTYLDKYKLLWNGHKAFAGKVLKIVNNTNAIEALVPQTMAGTGSSTSQKRQLKETMLQATLYLIGAGQPYAADEQDAGLEARMNFSYSDLILGSHLACLGRCRNIYTFLLPFADRLGDYSITPEHFVAQNNACNAFEDVISKPVSTRKDIQNANQQLTKLIDETVDIFKSHVDNFVKMMAAAQPEFYAGYKNARVIGGRSKARTDQPVDSGSN
jgi:hypothetical protein